jgi:phenylalanyl-tRNA synthetase beta chain
MHVPLSWLKDYVDINVPIPEMARRLTLAGLEVETIDYIGLPRAELEWDAEKIVVGELRAVHPHPDADSLLDMRGKSDLRLKVAFAMEGVQLYDGHAEGKVVRKLKKTKIRGVESRAMACSEKELGLSDEHVDIIYLPDDAPVGLPLVEYMGDAVLGFDIKGPFAHLQSVYGIARETAALLGVNLKRDVMEVLERHPAEITPTPGFIELEIADPDLCPRYSAAYIEGVTIGPSPFWMQMRLRLAGQRPISNIVDITNYVMMELGQPLHAFDYHFLRARPGEDKPAIIVRRARDGERMATLDGEMRTCDAETLLITDGGGPVAIGGVMGGLDSEVTDETRDVLLEAANFHFLNIRRTSRTLGLTTEASTRFGRGVDPELTVKAAARAAHLMAELGGGVVTPVIGDVYPGLQPQRVIAFDPALATRILGIEVPTDKIVRILTSLEFEVADGGSGTLSVTVPSHRLDVTRPVDLAEEVGRVWGYDRFPTTLMRDELPPQRPNPRLEGSERVRDILVGCGLDEVITYSLVDIEEEGQLWLTDASAAPSAYIRIVNPLSAERAYLRQALLPSVLRTTRENLRFVDRVATFEVGAVYLPVEGQGGLAGPLPDEPLHLSVVMVGPREPESWMAGQDRAPMDFYDLKGVVDALLAGLGVSGTFEPGRHPAFHPGRCARVSVGDSMVGVLGELHPQVREAFDLPEGQPVCALEFDLDKLLAAWGAPRTLAPISVHPPVYEDLAVVVDESVSEINVRNLITQTGSSLVRSVTLFDVYRGEQVGAGRKSLAYRLVYQADDRTLTDKEVAKQRDKIVRRLEQELGATLRS